MSGNAKIVHAHQDNNETATNTPENRIEFRNPAQMSGENDSRKIFIKGGHKNRVHYNPSEAASYEEEQEALLLTPSNAERIPAKRSVLFRTVQTIGVLASILWIVTCSTYFIMQGGIVTQTPYELGIFVAGMIAPIAFFWMILSYMQRNTDVRYYAESLRNELHSLFFPSDEDSRRVNRDIERMTAQAAELAASSKAALKAIHRTRQGLRHEIKEFASLAYKAERHILALSDGMVEKSDTLSKVTKQIDDQVDDIAKKSDLSVNAWDNAAARMIERAGEIEATMDKGANRILSMADIATEKSKAVSEMFDGTITSLGLTVDAVIDRLGNINDEFSTHTRTLERSCVDLSKETGRLAATVDDQVEQLQDATGRAVETITQSLVAVSEQKDALEDSAQTLSSQARDIASVIGGSVDRLDESANTITEKADAIEQRITEKSELIAKSLDGFDEKIDRIDSMSELASHRLSESIETAVNGSTQVSDAIRRGVDLLTRTSRDATDQATSLIESTISHIEQLKEIGSGNVHSVESMVELLERSRQQIEKASLTAQSHVETLTRAVDGQGEKLELSAASLAEQVKSVTHALEEPLRLVGIAIADADGRHEQIQTTLERRVQDLKEASDKATESVETIRQSLRAQTQDISALSGRVTAQAKSLNDELTENREQLSDTVETTLSTITHLLDGINGADASIRKTSQDIVQNVSEVNDTMNETVTRLSDASSMSVQALSHSGMAFTGQADTLEKRVEQAALQIQSTTDSLIYASEKITPLYDRVENGSVRALSNLNEFKDAYEETAELTLDKLNLAGNIFDERLNKLQNGSDDATKLLKSAGDYLRDRLDDIENAAKSANEKMRTIGNAMEGQSSDIHILTDQTILRIENIQKLIHEQFMELSEAVGQAVSQIDTAGETFDARAGKIALSADDITARFITAGDEAQAKAYELKQASQNVSQISAQVVTDISQQIVTLKDNSEGALSNLRKTADTLSIKSKEIDTMMRSVLDQAKSYSADMREQVRGIAAQSDESATMVGDSVTRLVGKMDEVNTKTKTVVNFIQETNQSLYEQSGRFVTAVAKSAQAAEQATDMFSRQAEALLKSAQATKTEAEDIRNAGLVAGRETFLSSARFVLESLHSLSIDFVRMIEGEISEKDWKQYQKGDVAIFTSYLAQSIDKMPADKIRNKYADDSEFRTYVQKFMRQFEDILEQTDTIDRGAILGTTFAASDVGKIYRFLCNVTGRDLKATTKAA